MSGPAVVLTALELEVVEAAHLAGLHADAPVVSGRTARDDEPPEVREARRSLVARGLLTRGADRLDATSRVGELLQLALDVRLGSAAVVVLERLLPGTGDEARHARVLHLLGTLAVVEDVHPEGWHGLEVLPAGPVLGDAGQAFLVPPDATAGEGEPRTVDLATLTTAPTLLCGPPVLAELTLVRPEGEPESWLAALGAGGCWAARRTAGRPVFGPVPPGWVATTIRSWVQDACGSGGKPGSGDR